MKKKLLVALLVGLVGLFGVSGAVFAVADCPDLVDTNEQTNDEFLKQAAVIAGEALAHAQQGHAAETRASAKEAIAALKCVVTNRGEAQIQPPKTRLKQASIAAKKGDTDKAAALLEESISQLKAIDMTPAGLGS